MDPAILSAVISAAIAILIAALNHFIITPYKEKKERMREQIKNLYAPLYGIVCARIDLLKDTGFTKNKLVLGSVNTKEYLEKEYMERFLLDNSGYASNKLLNAGINYTTNILSYDEEQTYEFVTTLVKDFNRFKKETGMEYNKEELETGIPECVRHLREVYSNEKI